MLTPFSNAQCPGGFGFGTSFRLFISAGVQDLTLDRVTIHMVDGTNLGGPSVTIPSVDLAPQPGSRFIRAGTTRDFPLRASFGCVAHRPRTLLGNAFLFDPFGILETIEWQGSIQ